MWLAFRNQVHELEERKRKYKKALKKGRRGAKKGTLWRTNSGYSTASAGVTSDEEGDDEVEGEGDDNVQRVSHFNLFPNLTVQSFSPPLLPSGPKVPRTNQFCHMIFRLDQQSSD